MTPGTAAVTNLRTPATVSRTTVDERHRWQQALVRAYVLLNSNPTS